MIDDLRELLAEFCSVPGLSGHEARIRAYIALSRAMATPTLNPVIFDRLDNLKS